MKLRNLVWVAALLSGLTACSKEPAPNGGVATEKKVVTLVTRDNPPYPQLAEYARDQLKPQNIELKITYANDGLIPNRAVANNEADLNFFQHQRYMESAKAINNWDLQVAASTFNGMFGAYSQKYKSIADLPNNAKVVIPSDPSNGGRALNLLHSAQLIELKPGTGAKTSIKDITANPKNLKIVEVEHALVPVSYKDADLVIMGGAYSAHANLIPSRDAILKEQDNREYDSVLVANSKSIQKHEVLAVKQVFESEAARQFILKDFSQTVTWHK